MLTICTPRAVLTERPRKKVIETFHFSTERLVICLFYLLIYEVVVTKVESVFFLIFQI